MNERATEINALAAALAKILVEGLTDEEVKLLAQFLLVLQNTVRSYTI